VVVELKDPILEVLPVAQWLMSFDVAFILTLFVVYLAFLAQAKTYFAEVWLQFVICMSLPICLYYFYIPSFTKFCFFFVMLYFVKLVVKRYTCSTTEQVMSQLWGVTYHMGSHSVTGHPTQVNTPRLNPSETGRYLIYLPRRDERLS